VIDDRERRERDPGRPPETFAVPVTRVDGGASDGRRARAAALAVVVFAAAVIVVALPRESPAAGARSPAPGQVAEATDAPTPRPARTRRPVTPEPTLPPIPDIASQVLPGAPQPAFYRRADDALEILVWVPGTADLDAVHSIPRAFEGLESGQAVLAAVSPDGRSAVLTIVADNAASSSLRLVGLDHDGPVWEGTIATFSSPVWSADSRWFVVAASEEAWIVVRAQPGAVEATEHSIEPPSDASPRPRPSEASPLAFSADGGWIYGGAFANDQAFRPVVRMATIGGAVEWLSGFPLDLPAGERPAGGLLTDTDLVTGRTAVQLDRATLEVLEPDGERAFRLNPGGGVLGMHWLSDGRLLVALGGPLEGAGTVRLVTVSADGSTGPVFETADPANASLIDVQDDHALLVFFGGPSPDEALLVMVRLVDGATASVPISQTGIGELIGLGWLD
jgi:hypothetical protein